MSADANLAKAMAVDRTDHISTLSEYQGETFDLLSRLKSRLAPVSNQTERPETDAMPAPVGSHVSHNVDNSRQINNIIRNLLDALEI